jgi:two-component system, OmpR family, sensor kinase
MPRDDLLYAVYHNLTINSVIAFIPLGAAVAGIAYIIVRSGLAPLRSAAAKAARIDAHSLSERIPESDLPSEVLPFVQAMNGALERVDKGIARERRITANATHELRTPIAILRARVDELDDAPLKQDIKRDVRRVQTIVEQLLVMAQIERQSAGTAATLDLGEIVLTIAADYMPIAIDNGRRVEFEEPTQQVFVQAERWAIESIVTNLVENAVRAEPEGGVVTIRVRPDAVIEVIDHGEGIAPADRELVFEPFWRKDDAAPGTGLGLSIVRELVTRIGGSISVDATQGRGATFAVRLKAFATREHVSGRENQLHQG